MKLFYLLIVLSFSVAFLSCSKNEDSDEEWRIENETYIEEIKNNAEYKAVTIPQGPGTIYYKVLNASEHGNGVYPIYTSKVKVH